MRLSLLSGALLAGFVWIAAGCSCGDGGTVEGTDGGPPPVDAPVSMMDGEAPSACGNGRVDRGDGEVCDDGNTVGGDGCSADCSSDESCGNGVIDMEAGEVCDDGNTMDGDACRADCLSDYQCGNGVVDTVASGGAFDEVCDDGNTTNGDGCSAGCDSNESCGNSIVDTIAGEVCDDGNTMDGDDCSADCMTSLLCGNGDLDGTEECDDGGTADGDGCSAICQIERCGNGRVDAGETCDDGNADDADGCTALCEYTCSADADCADTDVCNGTETCSMGGSLDSRCGPGTPADDGTSCGSGLICNGGSCVMTGCGDGLVSAPEQCDDGNTMGGDGCEADCTWTCAGAADCSDMNPCNGAESCTMPSTLMSRCMAGAPPADGTACGGGRICRMGTCTTMGCGDGVRTGSEQCDDGNTADGDGCDADCTWTCTGAASCSDGNACNGAETCTMPSTLMSRCMPGTPPSMGSACGAGRICVMGTCVMRRCGDGFVTSPEQCDDSNTVSGDGCDGDCTWTCASAADCSDMNVCTGTETCAMPSTLMSRCMPGTPPATGTVCDRDMTPGTRDICNMGSGMCVASRCGDSFVDSGTTPPEQCDDGNAMSGDGCSATCQTEMAVPPTGFRLTSLRLISPRITVAVPLAGCQDITDNCARLFGSCQADSVNTLLSTAVGPTSGGADYSLHIVNLFRPLSPASATSAMELHLNAACMEAPTPDSCGPDAMMPDIVMSMANNSSAGTCFTPVAADVNTRAGTPATYTPTVNTVSAPCFVSDEEDLTIDVGGIVVPLRFARVSATYSPSPLATRLVSGVVVGFLTEADAVSVTLPADIPLVGGDPLYEHLQAGNRSVMGTADGCNVGGGTSEDDADTVMGMRGFWFFLNFTAELVTWSGT